MPRSGNNARHVIVGAGPAGLTAAWQLAHSGRDVVVLEADDRHVGGLARTMEHAGHRYDMGPHRFYTKSGRIRELWDEMLPGGFVEVDRLTRIYYDRRFFPYPLALRETLQKLGAARALACGASWLKARMLPRRPERTFEDWITNRFGRRLYATFFKTYTEKVWGVPCAEISKDWAAQRIRGLSLPALIRRALFPSRGGGPKSLVARFLYPRRGAGQVWEAVADSVRGAGGRVALGRDVVRVHHGGGTARAVETACGEVIEGDSFHLTMTLARLVDALEPAPPPEVLAAGRGLRHRDFMTVALMLPREGLFPDQWIYVHDPGVRVARITNYASWNAAMSPSPATTTLGLEYFCNRGDALWEADDAALLERAREELATIGLSRAAPIDGRVHRAADAYPIYDAGYEQRRRVLAAWIAGHLRNVQPAGRKGLHNYNSQDHAMVSALLGVRNATEGSRFDVWSVNTDADYAEEGDPSADLEERLVPHRLGD